ncbi:glutathione S-transferase Mu 1-like isoform X1 [Ochotona curzoniae]|uniref:glutathione S-transferase Mu 1-like isoform X1 n=1 Tax=Ochotona curzoniae TaxID=130825 RepID=UPI001B34CC0F|nr:glutathione S-transferase Mu 1-like isoform X1 [Ochotona curzoniae]
MPMTLGYWDIRGLAHAIRLLLEYTDTSYEEKIYTMGDAPDYDRSQWLNEKFKLGLDFPNLPYLIDGTHKLTQSNAILRYLGRKYNLCGETEEEKIRVDILENQVMDTRLQLAVVCYSPDFVSAPTGSDLVGGKKTLSLNLASMAADTNLLLQEKLKPDYLKGLPDKLTLYSQFLGKRPWFAGDKITFADFLVYDILDQNRIFAPGCLDAFPNLKDFVARFEGLPKIAAYMKSSHFIRVPIYLKLATWTGK